MKVKELIERLQKLDQDEKIVIGFIDSEYGDSILDIEEILLEGNEFTEEKYYVICDSDYKELQLKY